MENTVPISVSMLVLFFVGALLFPEHPKRWTSIAITGVIFSPASMLLYERGNVDLFVFFLCAMIIITSSYSSNLTTLQIIFATIVKIFPFFGATVLLQEKRTRFYALLSICSIALLIYLIRTLGSFKAAWNQTMRGDELSYGTNILITRYENHLLKLFTSFLSSTFTNWILDYGPLLIAIIFLLVALHHTLSKQISSIAEQNRNLAAFRMGAAVYIGTFLLGNNWDYRLAFLAFVIPQIVDWILQPNYYIRSTAWVVIITIMLSCWHLILSAINFGGKLDEFWILFDEVTNWILFIELSYLFFLSLPDWLKIDLQRLPILRRNK